MDPVKIIKRAWYILWSYRALWVFGLILALTAGGTTSSRMSNNSSYQYDRNDTPQVNMTPEDMREGFRDFQRELTQLFERGIPEANVTGEDLTTFVWVVVALFVIMTMLGIVMAMARYVSETAVIRMVDEYETTGIKMTVRDGFRIGWSRASWRLFLINLIVNLPFIAFMLVALFIGVGVFFSVVNGNAGFPAMGVVTTLALLGITFFVVVILSIALHLLRPFFWRISVLEDAGVGESLRRGFAFVIENWKNVGLMWLVMIGLGIVWVIISIPLFIITIPLVIVTATVAALIVGLPYLLFVGIFSTFLGSWLPWAAGFLFVAPLFFTLAFSPWWLLGSWQAVFTSTVWTLTYREIKAMPNGKAEVSEIPAAS